MFRSFSFVLLALVLGGAAAAVPASPPMATAQGRPIEPREVALGPSDLPPGFRQDPDATTEAPIRNIGVSYTTELAVEPTPENLARGPVFVWQMVMRIDRLVVPADFFDEIRDVVVEQQKLSPLPGGVNSATGIHLVGQAPEDARPDAVVFGVGRVHDNFIWFTLVSGTTPQTSIQSAIALNQQSMAKYETVKAGGPGRVLLNALFATPFPSQELPDGFRAGNLVESPASERAAAHDAVGEIDLQVQGPTLESLLTYIVYPSPEQARASFDEAPGRAEERGALVARPDGFQFPVICAMRSGEIDGRKLGATSCLALVGQVEVSAYSVVEGGESGRMQDALLLMNAGVKHLEKVRQ